MQAAQAVDSKIFLYVACGWRGQEGVKLLLLGQPVDRSAWTVLGGGPLREHHAHGTRPDVPTISVHGFKAHVAPSRHDGKARRVFRNVSHTVRGKWIAWSQGIANAFRKLANSRRLGVLEGLRSQVSRWQKPLRGCRHRRAARLLCQLAPRAIATLRVNYCTVEYDIAIPRAKRTRVVILALCSWLCAVGSCFRMHVHGL